MFNFRKTFISSAMLIFLASCSGGGNKFVEMQQPSKNEALVYFYRPKGVGSLISYDIKESGTYVTTLKNGTYYLYTTSAGKKNFTAKTEAESKLNLEVEDGKVYFVRGKMRMGILVGRPKLELVNDTEKALSEIKKCNLVQ